MVATSIDTLRRIHSELTRCLHEQVVPFWIRHAIDPAGGISTCLDDEGNLLSTDKWLWSQWRAVWVFSRLYRQTNDARYLNVARHIYDFCCDHGWDDQAGGWRLCVAGDGSERRGCESIYVDGFALYGLAEFIAVTSDENAIRWARKTAESVRRRLNSPHDQIPSYPYPVPAGMRMHGLPMIFSLAFHELSIALADQDYGQLAARLSDEVFDRFYSARRDLVLEYVNADSTEPAAPLGTAVVPGHVIESMWFQIEIAGHHGGSRRIDQAVGLIRRHLEVGWDEQHGGLFLAVDADGRDEIGWAHASMKLWWPHTEAMYALVRAYELTGQSWCLDWYAKIHDYAFSHFPHPTAGEWVQRLDRSGKPVKDFVALPVKDPFHLPRALLLSIESLDRILAAKPRDAAKTVSLL